MKSPRPWILISFVAVGGHIASTARSAETVVMASQPEVPTAEDGKRCASGDDSQDVAAAPSIAKDDRLQKFEAVMERYYRGDPLEKTRTDLNRSIEEYNQWMKSTQAQLKADSADLNHQVDAIRALDKSIGKMDKRLAEKPDLRDEPAVEAYNALVSQRNERVREYNELAASHKKSKQAYNDSLDEFEREADTRKSDLDAQQAAFERQIEAHKHWFGSGEDLTWFKDLNRLYARLHQERRNSETPELDKMIDKTRAIRRELFQDVVERYGRAETGAVIVEATLCRGEPCFLLVDTGAMAVTIPSSLVEALGLSNRIGKEVQATVAGGGRIRGRELIIPQLSVLGREAEDVRAIVLDEFDAGVDGSLGLSYLKRFAFRIDQSHRDRLIIESSATATDSGRSAK